MRCAAWLVFLLLGLHIFGVLTPVAEALDSMGFTLGETDLTLLGLVKGWAC